VRPQVSSIAEGLVWAINSALAAKNQKLIAACNAEERALYGRWRIINATGKVVASRVRLNRLAAACGLIRLAASR
jgi:hypothetical protein